MINRYEDIKVCTGKYLYCANRKTWQKYLVYPSNICIQLETQFYVKVKYLRKAKGKNRRSMRLRKYFSLAKILSPFQIQSSLANRLQRYPNIFSNIHLTPFM